MNLSNVSSTNKSWVIPISLLGALILMILPYPEWMQFAIPRWVSLVLFYWCLALPSRIGVGIAWMLGLIMDVFVHSIFGTYAIALSFVAMVAINAHKRLRMYHLWQQCVIVFVMSVIEISFVGWIFHLTHNSQFNFFYYESAFSTALLWPVVYAILRFLRQRNGLE